MAKALEIPFSSVAEEHAIVPDASIRFPAAMSAQSDVVPASNVVQIGPAFRLRGVSQNRARLHPLPAGLAHGMHFRARALFSVLLAPFASSARHSFERFVDLPKA